MTGTTSHAAASVTRRDHALGLALCCAYVAVLLYTAPDLGLSRDEGMYVYAAESYARWFELLAHDPGAAFEQAAIDGAWRTNNEHPPLVKTLFALSHLLDQHVSLFTRESLAFRFPGMVSAGLLLWLLYVFGTRLFGRRAGLFAACAYALLPRPFYHAHLNAFDVPITLAVTAVTYGYYRSLRSRRWGLATGVLFGLALATKHNSWILPGTFAIHFALVLLLDRTRGRRELSPVPWWLIAMVLLGPLLLFALWPWLWHDPWPRFRAYAKFHLHHDYYNIAYFGVNYFWPPFPFSYPWVMTLFTVPVTTLLLALVGLWQAGQRTVAQLRRNLARALEPDDDATYPLVLLLGGLLAPLAVFALPSQPIFGGTKHWFTAYPFMALFAGLAFDHLLRACASWLPERFARWQRPLCWPVGGLLLLPALVETAHSHPFGLSHYGLAAGFVPGAADHGMNRQFWGFTTGSLTDFFDRALPHGGTVYVCDTLDYSFSMLSRDGLITDRVHPTRSIVDADLALVHHEHHFAEVDQQIWTLYGTTQPIYVLTYDGVPIISVYKNPRSKR